MKLLIMLYKKITIIILIIIPHLQLYQILNNKIILQINFLIKNSAIIIQFKVLILFTIYLATGLNMFNKLNLECQMMKIIIIYKKNLNLVIVIKIKVLI